MYPGKNLAEISYHKVQKKFLIWRIAYLFKLEDVVKATLELIWYNINNNFNIAECSSLQTITIKSSNQ